MKMFWRKTKQSRLESDPIYKANLHIARGTPQEILIGGLNEFVNNRGFWTDLKLACGWRAPRSILAYEQALVEKTRSLSVEQRYKPRYWRGDS